MRKFLFIISILLIVSFASEAKAEAINEPQHEDLDIKEMILSHIADSYEWHFLTWKGKDVSIPLPIIL